MERIDEWLNRENLSRWPSIVVVLADTILPGQRRNMQIAFAKPLSVNVTGLVEEAPTVELAGEDGSNPVALRLGRSDTGPARAFANVSAVFEAFAAIEWLRRVQIVATAEPLLDFLAVEGGVARIERTDETLPNEAGGKFRLVLFGPTQFFSLKANHDEWRISRIASGP
ncbi:hypothetical protein [Zavarzinella formosa]|uniref:hypothetical protein n=1 Tax=Zavarzinella formosa TaxID=360055 RepID=UPI0012F7E342|nr:hypothetical protein [Zavarzinella formosa]